MCGETRDRVGFGPLPQGPRNSSIYTALRALFRLRDLFSQKLAIATSCTSFVSNDQTKTAYGSPPLSIPHIYLQYSDCFIIFLLVLRLLAGIDLRGQADRASGIVSNLGRLV